MPRRIFLIGFMRKGSQDSTPLGEQVRLTVVELGTRNSLKLPVALAVAPEQDALAFTKDQLLSKIS